VGAAAAVGPAVALLVAAFLILQLAYSLGLKRVVGPDVLVIALLFAIRAAAGAEAVRVRVSPWLLACTALLALFLALGKRRAELSAFGDGHRAVLSRYSVATLDRLLLAVAGATVGAYVAYAVAARDSYEMALTIPFVVVALLRYLVLIRRDGLGEAPDEILVRDRYVLPTVAAWAVTAALLLTLS
jgi:4-hydroxybenzoate polyprenyltransferase